jgi:hypothetical protein
LRVALLCCMMPAARLRRELLRASVNRESFCM